MPDETSADDKALKILVDVLSHDINNHIHGASGYLELMEHMLKEDPTMRRFLGNAMSEMKSVSHLVENIRLLVNVPREPFVEEPVDLYSQLVLAQETASYRFEEKTMELETMLRHGEIVVKADRFLQNCLVEILTNSMRYDSQNIVKVWLAAIQEGAQVTITIGDQGNGIPDDQKDGLMTRFWRSIQKADVHGKGMGLSVVKMVVERYGGEVSIGNRVEGDHSQGTKIVLKLPLWVE